MKKMNNKSDFKNKRKRKRGNNQNGNYLSMLTKFDSVPCTSPSEYRKMYYKRVRYQDTLTVNSSGHLGIFLAPHLIAKFAYNSTASPLLYLNQSAYDPTSSSNNLTGGWNVAFTAGMNMNQVYFETAEVIACKIAFTVTGVLQQNRTGIIHAFEDVGSAGYYGKVDDPNMCEVYPNDYTIQDLPKCVHYVKDNNLKTLRYNYIPFMPKVNRGVFTQTISSVSSNSSDVLYITKIFGYIIQGANTATKVNVEYEIDFAIDMRNDYVNDYPPKWSLCYFDPDRLTIKVNQNTNNIVRFVSAG